MKNLILIILASAVLWSCEKAVILDLKQTESRVVIEGLVTDNANSQYVKVTRTSDFYGKGETPRVTNAIVSVKDDLNNNYLFVPDPDSAGYYFPQPSFTGEIGRTYHLTVEVDGKIYEAEDKMFNVTSIDSLKFRADLDEKKDPKKKDKFFSLLVFAKEPQETKDYYLFKFYRNDSLLYDDSNDVYVSDDDFLSENIDGVDGPGYYGLGDTAKVEAYSLPRSGYIYYSDLQQLLRNDGGLFGSPPANCRTNLTNGAIGYFQVSAMKTKSRKLD